MAAPRPDTAAQIDSAVARSLGSVKITRMSDSVVGMIIAPPTPRIARTPITASAVGAHRISSDAAPKMR